MKTIESRTSFQHIDKPGQYKPISPLWIFRNSGSVDMFINGVKYAPGEVFGVDNSMFIALAMLMDKGVRVVEGTYYEIFFGSAITDGVSLAAIPKCTLITVEYIQK